MPALLAVHLCAGPIAAQARHEMTAQVRTEFTQVHMGVPVRLVLFTADTATARAAASAAYARIAALENRLSDYRPHSELRRLERRPRRWVPVGDELYGVLATALEIARASDGAFDPTVGPLVRLWRDARRTGRLPEPEELEAARARVGWNGIALDPERGAVRLARAGMRLDLGGIAKGFILQQALATLDASGAPRALVEAGGDIVVGGPPPGRPGWRIETPFGDSAVSERARALSHAVIATSGPDEQFVVIDGVRYSHVVDPRTGIGLTSGWTATVVARDAARADALATALTVLGPAHAAELRARFPEATVSITRSPPSAR